MAAPIPDCPSHASPGNEELVTDNGAQDLNASENMPGPTSTADVMENAGSSKISVSLVSLCLALSIFLVALDTTILSTAIPRITNDFESLKDVGWYAGVYSLTTAVFQVLYGKFFTVFPLKWTFVSAIAVFELGSILCAAAKSSTTLIVGRAFAGIGGAGIGSGTLVTISQLVPLRWRPMANAAFGSIFGVSSVVGPVLGGLLTDKLGWRWCFWINLPFGFVTIIVVIIFLNPLKRNALLSELSSESTSIGKLSLSVLKQLNVPSMAILIGSILSLLLALQWRGAKYQWDNGRILALLVVAGTSCTGFVLLQVRQKDKAFIPMHVLKQRTVWACCWYAFSIGSTAAVFVYFLPIWFQAVLGVSALRSGILNLPFVMSLIAGSIIAGGLTSYTGQFAPLMIISCVIRAIGAGLLTTLKPTSSMWRYILFQIIFGLGDGFGMQQPMIAIQTTLAQRDIAMGLSVLMFCQILGSAIFVVVGQSLFNDRLSSLLSAVGGEVDIDTISNAGATAFRSLGLNETVLNKVILSFNTAITNTFYVGVAMSCASTIGALAVEWRSVKTNLPVVNQSAVDIIDEGTTRSVEHHDRVQLQTIRRQTIQ